ncbi:MAG TPA: ADP-forming succinate--CoA ligase subunit beta [Chloroflexota bacterium]|nr:ADP-forming succinate--CoA ligase subunit beta [Chloroflexota bacterium]
MNLHEYQAKELLAARGVPILPGKVAFSPAEARDIAAEIGKTVVVKAQVLTGGRGKAGGVRLVRSPDEAEEAARQILGMSIKGITVKKVLVAEAAEIVQEIYLGAVLDRPRRGITLMASAAGGIDIEEVARDAPEKILRAAADPFLGLADYQARELGFGLGLSPTQVRQFARIAQALFRTLIESDATLCEINPLALGPDGNLTALDAKVSLDDNALFRQKALEAQRDLDEEDPLERRAREQGINFVKLDGTIGCIVNGAGLAMATMDAVKMAGAAPANFMDVAGGARADRVAAALRIILSDPNVKAVLFNIFGGITRCDEVARGLLAAKQEVDVKVPIVVRLVGTNEEEGRRLLREAGIGAFTTMKEAADAVVAAAGGRAP